jgi:hypothetical protein
MKRCNLDCQFLSEFDLFGKDPEFYFKGKPQRTSKFGKFLTYFYITIYVGFFLYKIIRMLKKVDITFFESYAYSGIPSIKLTNNLFYGGFSLDGVIDPSLYYPLVYYYKGHRENGIMIWEEPYEIVELEICQIEKFGKKYRDIFKNKDLDHSYCLKDVEKITLEGYSHLDSFKYLYVAFMPCVGINPITQTACQSETDVKNYFMKGAQITFNIEDIELTPHLYDTPSQPLEKDINGPCFLTLYQQIYTYLQIVILETDQDWIGFEGLSDIETEQFLKYDESWIVAAPSPHSLDLDARTPLAEVTVQLSSKVLTQKRKNTKLIEVLGDVGGLMEVVWSFFNILSSVITDLLYQKALINNLFTFDLDKKIVKLKKKNSLNEKETMKLNDCPKIYSLNSRNDALSGKIINKQDPSKDKLDEDALNKKFDIEVPKTVKKKKKKKLKNKLTIGSSISKNNELTNKNLEEDHLKNPDEIDIYNNDNPNNVNHFNNGHGMPSEDKFINKETERNIYSRRIVDRIKVNCCCIYFWFCFARKKKNTQNVLWDEGMDILVENLDIMNIFKKVYNMNLVEETLKVNELFDMSEKCKTKIDALDQMFLKKQIKE